MRQSTIDIIRAAQAVLEGYGPSASLTIRQLYYQLVVAKVLPNSQSSYKKVGRAMVKARKEGLIPWGRIEDRLRLPRGKQMWPDVATYLRAVANSFHADVWEWQPRYMEFWLEKEALAGIFEEELDRFGIILNVGRGYDGWSSIRNAANRFKRWAEKRSEIEGSRRGTGDCTIVYFGDFDPSGEDMVRSLEERLGFFGVRPVVYKSSITPSDIERYNLPPDPTKLTDSRSPAFIAEHGRMSTVELDALPIRALQQRIRREASSRMDPTALQAARDVEVEARAILEDAIRRAGR
jgi:hypothetical protein